MATDYPYMMSNNKIDPILEKIRTAAKPPKFTNEFLKNIGFTSSNDRAIIPLLKKLGFLTADGIPTEYYGRLKDKKDHSYVLAEKIRELYSDIFAINTQMNDASDDDIKGAFGRVTGEDEKAVIRFTNTFKALCSLAKFGISPEKETKALNMPEEIKPQEHITQLKPAFHYNIQIHLSATTEISVYNAIFKSLKDNLLP
ncbi:MAG: DUF5343 domain-containing protein [Nitrospinae bacterium]|nr:DUF5343 domain-containing protein [Nitrospinota bacterium]MBI3812937.1 DUF5343 domain-containing protein [Nitrospinota bacterium]